jgi:hypothetical protein
MRLKTFSLALWSLCAGQAWARNYQDGDWGDWGGLLKTPGHKSFDNVIDKQLAELSNATQVPAIQLRDDEPPSGIDAFLEGGRTMDCLMRSTQEEANQEKQNNPWLANKPVISTYTDPNVLRSVGWSPYVYNDPTVLSRTRDARNDIGGGVADDTRYFGLKTGWKGPNVPTTDGGRYVSYCNHAVLGGSLTTRKLLTAQYRTCRPHTQISTMRKTGFSSRLPTSVLRLML